MYSLVPPRLRRRVHAWEAVTSLPTSATLPVLDKGLVIAGDILVNLLDIELLTIKLRLVIAASANARDRIQVSHCLATPTDLPARPSIN